MIQVQPFEGNSAVELAALVNNFAKTHEVVAVGYSTSVINGGFYPRHYALVTFEPDVLVTVKTADTVSSLDELLAD